tara:strand:+ start:15986 stop:16984 length:999 start_codon:yes stop_codon:yes gene_type:complete
MKLDKQKEEIFYSKSFSFSYSSINKLLHSPALFYKDYILLDKEEKTDKHLIEGKLLHCLLLIHKQFNKLFTITPNKLPSENIKKVLKGLSQETNVEELDDVKDDLIIKHLKYQNLHQSLNTDEQRVAKVKVDDFKPYWKFISTSKKDVIDQDMYDKAKSRVEIMQSNIDIMDLIGVEATDFELDSIEVYKEKPLECELKKYNFGLKGIIDHFSIDHDKKTITINDVKTTGKTLSDFPESIEYYNYWLQAAIYCKLVYEFVKEECKNYKIIFNFVTIDKYNQVYVFNVSDSTMSEWTQGLAKCLTNINVHFETRDYSVPYHLMKDSEGNKFKL